MSWRPMYPGPLNIDVDMYIPCKKLLKNNSLETTLIGDHIWLNITKKPPPHRDIVDHAHFPLLKNRGFTLVDLPKKSGNLYECYFDYKNPFISTFKRAIVKMSLSQFVTDADIESLKLRVPNHFSTRIVVLADIDKQGTYIRYAVFDIDRYDLWRWVIRAQTFVQLNKTDKI
jgi:hypothetical protein